MTGQLVGSTVDNGDESHRSVQKIDMLKECMRGCRRELQRTVSTHVWLMPSLRLGLSSALHLTMIVPACQTFPPNPLGAFLSWPSIRRVVLTRLDDLLFVAGAKQKKSDFKHPAWHTSKQVKTWGRKETRARALQRKMSHTVAPGRPVAFAFVAPLAAKVFWTRGATPGRGRPVRCVTPAESYLLTLAEPQRRGFAHLVS